MVKTIHDSVGASVQRVGPRAGQVLESVNVAYNSPAEGFILQRPTNMKMRSRAACVVRDFEIRRMPAIDMVKCAAL